MKQPYFNKTVGSRVFLCLPWIIFVPLFFHQLAQMPALTDSSSSRLGSSTSVSEGFHKHDDPPSSQTDQARESISSLDVSAIFDGDDVVDEDENDVSPIVNTFHPLARPKSFLLPSPSPSPPPVNKPATPLVHHASSSSSSAERYDAIEGLLYRRPSYSAPNQNELSKSRHRLRGATLPALLRRLTSLELSTKDDAWAFLTRSRSLISPVHLLAFLSARFFMDTYRPTSLCHPYNPLTKYRRTDPTHLSKVRSFLNVINIHPKSRCPTSSSGEKVRGGMSEARSGGCPILFYTINLTPPTRRFAPSRSLIAALASQNQARPRTRLGIGWS